MRMDREKVIKGLECCVAYDYKCNDCPYQDDGGAEDGCYSDELKADALALLKAQEPMEPIRDINGVYYCGICETICVGYEVDFTNSIIKVENYCHKCGRKVKWV